VLLVLIVRRRAIAIGRVERGLEVLEANHFNVNQLVAVFDQLHELSLDLHGAALVAEQRTLVPVHYFSFEILFPSWWKLFKFIFLKFQKKCRKIKTDFLQLMLYLLEL
jgi:hypothetical protein